MTIYDLTLYGVHIPRLAGASKVHLSQDMDEVYKKAGQPYRFEVTVLRRYGSKKDVLELRFMSGRTEYVTLYEPTMYLELGEWQPTENRTVADQFLSLYAKINLNEKEQKEESLYDLEFFGMIDCASLGGQPTITVSISNEDIAEKKKFFANAREFKAKILRHFEGKKNVMMVTSNGVTKYMPLFNNKLCYDQKKAEWVEFNESPIPIKILECYIEYLNP